MQVNRKQLLDVVRKSNTFYKKKVSLYQLLGCRLSFSSGVLSFRATDLDVEITADFKTGDGEPFDVLVEDRKEFQQILTKLKCDEIGLAASTKSLIISHPKGEIEIPLSGDEFVAPHLRDAQKTGEFEFDFLEDFQKVATFASTDDLRPAMTCVNFATVDGRLEIAATNAHVLAKAVELETAQDYSFKVPAKYHKIVPRGKVEVYARNGQTIVKFRGENYNVCFKDVDARFPDYNVVIPQEYNSRVKFWKKDLKGSIDIALLTTNKQTKKIEIDADQSHIYSQDEDFGKESRTKTKMEIVEGDDMHVAFNADYLTKLMAGIENEEFEMRFLSSNKAVVVKEENMTFLIMPIAL